jgi:hypothetical protein
MPRNSGMRTRAKSPKKDREVSERSRNKEFSGICSTCKKAPVCTYRRDPERPVLRCNEFESYGKPSVFESKRNSMQRTTGNGISRTTGSGVKSSAELEMDSGKYKGLCKSCKNREICTFSKPEGGVWHCEEYR